MSGLLSQAQNSFERSLAKNNAGSSDWSGFGKKDALTFFDPNCADNKNNRPGERKMLTETELASDRAGGKQGAPNQEADVGQAVGCRWAGRDSVFWVHGSSIRPGERKFRQCSACRTFTVVVASRWRKTSIRGWASLANSRRFRKSNCARSRRHAYGNIFSRTATLSKGRPAFQN